MHTIYSNVENYSVINYLSINEHYRNYLDCVQQYPGILCCE